MIEKQINVSNHSYLVEYPDECPICHHHSEVHLIRAEEINNRTEVNVVFQCGYAGCKRHFIGYYGPITQKELKSLEPKRPNTAAFPESIITLSPKFVEIYPHLCNLLKLRRE